MTDILIILLLILFNGLLALSEVALISVRKSFLANEIKKGDKAAKIALQLANAPEKFLSTVQIGITIIGILTGLYSGSVLADDFSSVLIQWGLSATYAAPLAQALIVVGVTYLTLIFGELVPKKIGMSLAEKSVKMIARPMFFLSKIAAPFVWILSQSTSFIFRLFGFSSDEGKVTEAEIKSMIEEGTKDGEVQEVEQDIVERVFMLGDLRVSSLMTHRTEITWLDIRMRKEDIQQVMHRRLHQMYPVIDQNLDTVKGIITLKELILQWDDDDFSLDDILRPAVFFHENMSVYKALERLKEKGLSQALICDEFGSFQGIISLKDILQGLVGALNDPHEEPDIIQRQDCDQWLIDGQCPFFDFLAYFDREELHTKEYNTLGGLVLECLEHIPQVGEQFSWKGFHFEIIDMDGVRIDKILVSLEKAEDDRDFEPGV